MSKAGDKFREMLKKVPLESRVRVAIDCYFINKHGGSLLMPASEEGEEYDEIMRINGIAQGEAKPIIDMVLKEIEGWKEDGMPEKRNKKDGKDL